MTAPVRNLDLAVIGNCEIAALVASDAAIVWGCLPRMDADPVFCALLEPDTPDALDGSFALELVDCVETQQRYLRNSAILETVMTDSRGNQLRVVDFCPRFRARGLPFTKARGTG